MLDGCMLAIIRSRRIDSQNYQTIQGLIAVHKRNILNNITGSYINIIVPVSVRLVYPSPGEPCALLNTVFMNRPMIFEGVVEYSLYYISTDFGSGVDVLSPFVTSHTV